MKSLLIIILLVFAICPVDFAQTADSEKKIDPNAPEITFVQLQHDFGKLKNGAECAYEFEFKNTGVNDLVLTNVRPTCGCTIAQGWQEIGPVKKGKSAKVKINYDSKRTGVFNKTITVTSNAKNDPVTLTIKGEIDPPERQIVPENNLNNSSPVKQ